MMNSTQSPHVFLNGEGPSKEGVQKATFLFRLHDEKKACQKQPKPCEVKGIFADFIMMVNLPAKSGRS
jgi:hypothetical protein